MPPQLTAGLLDGARLHAHQHGQTLLLSLQDITGWDCDTLMQVLGEAFHYPVLSAKTLHELTPDFDRISFTECVQRHVLIASDATGGTHLILADPFDGMTEEWAWHRHGLAVPAPRVALAHPDDLDAYLAQQERTLRAMDGFGNDQAGEHEDAPAAVITLATISDDASPVVKLVNSTIYDALKLQASDIHLECDGGCLQVQYRIDGVLVPVTRIHSPDMAEQVISRIKVMAELDIAERRIPQDGRFKVHVGEREIDFRVSVMPNIFGEDAVLRLLDRQALTEQAKALRLENLGLDRPTCREILKLANKPHGMLLVTGPTGSGKTTTLYAAITEIHTGRDKIITIEDPIEYRLPGVLQIPVNEKKGLTFAKGLRSILRHDPDKIMIGEIRDDETAQIAIQAALTGHLVFTTVHANNVFDVLGRFLHMGVDAYSFAAALNGIVAQRLVRLNCLQCTAQAQPSANALEALGLRTAQVTDWHLCAGQGCAHCRGTGYKGRKAIAEVLLLDDTLRELIARKAPILELKERASQAGFCSIRDTALEWVARGETTLEEVARVAG